MSPGEQDRNLSGLLLKNTVYSPLLPKGMIPLFRSSDDSLLGRLSSLLSYKRSVAYLS